MAGGFKFLHCADLHIGSAFTGLRRRLPELGGELAETPFAAWRNVVTVALREKVDFVLISGDCFDRDAPTLRGRLEFVRQLDRLAAAQLPVCIVAGNHDPAPEAWSATVALPENVKFFRTDAPELCPIIKAGRVVATVGGIGHASRNVTENLALRVGEALREAPGRHIALVHANLAGDLHAAPASLAELRNCPVDYWALGHLHKAEVRSEYPHVVYSGCPQGRDVNEAGARGCYTVEFDASGTVALKFHSTAVLEFERFEVSAGDTPTFAALEAKINATLDAGSRAEKLLFRLALTGASPLDAELRRTGSEELHRVFAAALRGRRANRYLEELQVRTRAAGAGESFVLAPEIDRSVAELAKQRELEKLYDEMRIRYPALPRFRPEDFTEIRAEAAALLTDALTALETGEK